MLRFAILSMLSLCSIAAAQNPVVDNQNLPSSSGADPCVLAATGDARAQFECGWQRFSVGDEKNLKAAADWYRKAAEQGYASAQRNLGVMYSDGRGVPKDEAQAYMWYNLAAALGNDRARSNRAILEKTMSRVEIEKAQAMSREWSAKHQP